MDKLPFKKEDFGDSNVITSNAASILANAPFVCTDGKMHDPIEEMEHSPNTGEIVREWHCCYKCGCELVMMPMKKERG